MMDFGFSTEQEQWRKEIREFLERELPPRSQRIPEDQRTRGFSKDLARKLGQKGWFGITWPKKYGGQERSNVDRTILTEELLRAGAPCGTFWVTERQIGPALILHGSEKQKEFFLPQIVRGELTCVAAFSEPEAGSDLASLRTVAKEDGDKFVINGQKLWMSAAYHADYIYLLARTDPSVVKHRGISEFIIDSKLPGISMRAITDISGEADFAEVFFDNVVIPKETLVGEKNRGWYQIVSQLSYERTGLEYLMCIYPLFEDLVEYAKSTGLNQDAIIRNKLADLEIGFEIGRLLVYRAVLMQDQGLAPDSESSMAKVYCTEWEQRVGRTAMDVLGLASLLMPGSKGAVLLGRAARAYLFSMTYTIYAGTSEALRGIVALRGLGLPR